MPPWQVSLCGRTRQRACYYMYMPVLERHVHVLFDPEDYDALESLARQEKRSVGSIIRDSVRRVIAHPANQRQAALERLFARADAAPSRPLEDWAVVKESFERDTLQAIA